MAEVNEDRGVVEYQARDGNKIKLSPSIIKRYLVSGRSEYVTDQEMYLYMGICKSRGLNPFIRDAHLVKYTEGESAAIITSIDYYRKRARAQKDCRGWTTGIVVVGPPPDKKLIYREGCILLDGETLAGGWAEATPTGWEKPMRKEVNLARYIKKTRDGKITRFWQPENQPEMISKVAESQLLRTLWPDEFQGLYVDAEMASREAQDELTVAVGTGSGADDPAERFAATFAEDLKDKRFGEFIIDAFKNYAAIKKSPAEVKVLMADDPAKVRAAFVSWLTRETIAECPAAEEPKKVDPGPPPAEVVEDGPPDLDEKGPEIDSAPDETGGKVAEVKASSREAIIAEIKKYSAQEIRRAKAAMQIGMGPNVWPPTVEGCGRLLDHLIRGV